MKNYLLSAFLLFSAFLAPEPATAQSPAAVRPVLTPLPDTMTVRGRVTDLTTGQGLPGVTVLVKGTSIGTSSNQNGEYRVLLPKGATTLVFNSIGYITVERSAQRRVDVVMSADTKQLSEVVVTGAPSRIMIRGLSTLAGKVPGVAIGQSAGRPRRGKRKQGSVAADAYYDAALPRPAPGQGESYEHLKENGFSDARRNPLSTFSIDVDAASYSNVRRFLQQGQRPPADAVRVEEMINYFSYSFPQPTGPDPFSVHTELTVCPWDTRHQLVQIALQGKRIETTQLPPANLVFLVDVSGSMSGDDRLGLVQAGLRLLVRELRPQDKVALVVYAGAAGLVLPATAGSEKSRILNAIDNLQAGGSTAGGEGLRLAYRVAREQFQKEGNNRVILATDGDFNVGESSDDAMEHLITEERESGVFLTVLGVGQGNYRDSKMERLADKGNGNYAYLDNLDEARRVLVRQFGGTLFTIAKDVKLQVEFNPARVQQYRLVGYENRALEAEDFNNDRKDAGELGAGHTVTALYEIVPVGAPAVVDPLKYQTNAAPPAAASSTDLLTVKLRYKEPQGLKSKLMEQSLVDKAVPLAQASENLRFAAAVAQFGMLLRGSDHRGSATYEATARLAEGARGTDSEGYRAELIRLIRLAENLSPTAAGYGAR
ncbi:von Willebrand factor type A domain-containing protein [Hymenobacter sp. BT175]|uniref:YfbK domain-containing protein n=1 Tax=Hymenobacter translucens TaxID=2886507 RepID=UPI001D0E2FD1|nr:von Willebrand factor type A domain-containing protein [Hymenobacter translucens]MCC2545705.1 von Willebrand factor type A domain-containing protein [Hymenobacter translucens]